MRGTITLVDTNGEKYSFYAAKMECLGGEKNDYYYKPEIGFFRFLEKNDYRGFFAEEMKARKAFFLPPFSEITTMSFRGKNREKVFEKAREKKKKWRE